MVSKSNQYINSQLERANGILKDLNKNVTTSDREEAVKELNLSQPTVARYLIGKAKKIDLAMVLIEFFRKRIDERDRKLQGAA